MAVLPAGDRADLTAEIQRTEDCPGGLTKAQLREAFDALDDWWETTGFAAANAAIPQPQRGLLKRREKAALFFRLLTKKHAREVN